VPRSTDARIEKITARIHSLCSAPLTDEAEAELRTLAKDLGEAIHQHVSTAKRSPDAKQAATGPRDSDSRKK
jgi:hypothetical protein